MAPPPIRGPSAHRTPGHPLPPPTPPPDMPLPAPPPEAAHMQRLNHSPHTQGLTLQGASISGLRSQRNASQDSVLSAGYQSATSQLNSSSEASTPTLAHFRDQRFGSPRLSHETRGIRHNGSPTRNKFSLPETDPSSSSTQDSAELRSRLSRVQSTVRGFGQKLRAAQESVLSGRSPGSGLSWSRKEPLHPSRDKGKARASDDSAGPAPIRGAFDDKIGAEDGKRRPTDYAPWTLGGLGLSPRSRQALQLFKRHDAKKSSEEASLLPELQSPPLPPLRSPGTAALVVNSPSGQSSDLPYLKRHLPLASASMSNLRSSKHPAQSTSHVTFKSSPGGEAPEVDARGLFLRERSSSLSASRAPTLKTGDVEPVPPLPVELTPLITAQGLTPRTLQPAGQPFQHLTGRNEDTSFRYHSGWGVQGGRVAGRQPGEGFVPKPPSSNKPSSSHGSHHLSNSDATTVSDTLWSQSGRNDGSSSHTRGTSASSSAAEQLFRKGSTHHQLGEASLNALGLQPESTPEPSRDRLELKLDALTLQLETFLKETSERSRTTTIPQVERLPTPDGQMRHVMILGQHSIPRMAKFIDPLLEKLLDAQYAQIVQSDRGPTVAVKLKEPDLDWLQEYDLYKQPADLKFNSRDPEYKQIRDRTTQLKRLHQIAQDIQSVFPGAVALIEDGLLEEYENAFEERLRHYTDRPYVTEIATGLRSMAIYRLRNIKDSANNAKRPVTPNETFKITTGFPAPFALAPSQANRSFSLLEKADQVHHQDSNIQEWMRAAVMACDCLRIWLNSSDFSITDAQIVIEKNANQFRLSLSVKPPRYAYFEAAHLLARANSVRQPL